MVVTDEAAAGRRKKKTRPAPEARTEFRGVCRQPSGRYRGQIKRSGTTLHLGIFDTAHEAARGYDAAAAQLHGAKAITNFKRRQSPAPTAAAAHNDGEAMDFSGFPEVPVELRLLPYGILQLP
ncbi:ethylene-responsive transcription factor 9 [Brachypodium distachyon]|uniref:AP2/ERF domain-containing protein n=1 Tax=Brachypodium distachyon TaxID=15368 RepID=I1I690_BRADI|nr:ethylene-responsive transcription factor 9 [Brachypodium distachyon]KQJ97845.1 hypothetical protein BRADI_3g33670v3 [Brachypodium distachyon]|eukprot:XP_010236663.1 ethylene-responsive transcription factor 9 [Brachypodium distachyon]